MMGGCILDGIVRRGRNSFIVATATVFLFVFLDEKGRSLQKEGWWLLYSVVPPCDGRRRWILRMIMVVGVPGGEGLTPYQPRTRLFHLSACGSVVMFYDHLACACWGKKGIGLVGVKQGGGDKGGGWYRRGQRRRRFVFLYDFSPGVRFERSRNFGFGRRVVNARSLAPERGIFSGSVVQ